jgi:hypothetical protein
MAVGSLLPVPPLQSAPKLGYQGYETPLTMLSNIRDNGNLRCDGLIGRLVPKNANS